MTKTALLIEDNEQNRYRVVHAANGPAGIALAQTLVPDHILLDIQLPMMDGYAVARSLRAISALDRTPIIAVTSYAMVGDREKSLAAGCSGYIEKPIDPETFVSEVERLVHDAFAEVP